MHLRCLNHMKSSVLRAQAEHAPDIDMSDLVDTMNWKSCLCTMLLRQYVLVGSDSTLKKHVSALTQLNPKRETKWLSGWTLNRLDRCFADAHSTSFNACGLHDFCCHTLSHAPCGSSKQCSLCVSNDLAPTVWKHCTLSMPEQTNKRIQKRQNMQHQRNHFIVWNLAESSKTSMLQIVQWDIKHLHRQILGKRSYHHLWSMYKRALPTYPTLARFGAQRG